MAKRKANKSEAIRQYLAEHPNAATKDIAKALRVNAALVYNVKSSLKSGKKKKASARKPVKRKARKKAVSHAQENGNGTVAHVIAAARLIRTCGGPAEAREAIRAAELVSAALDG